MDNLEENTFDIVNTADSFNKLVTQAGTNYLGTHQKLPEEVEVGFGTTLIAQFQNENTLGNLIANIKNGTLGIKKDANPDYDPTDDIPEDKLRFWENYALASSPQDVDKITRKIDWELQNKQTLRKAGLGKSLTTGLIAGILDPINLIPVGGTLYKTGKLGKIGVATLNTATAGFVSSVAQETVLNSQQETRTPEETAMNIAGGTILSGVLGGAGALISKIKFNKLAKNLEQDIHSPKSNIELDPRTQEVLESTAGAKQYKELERLQLEQAYKKHTEDSLQSGKKPLTEEQFIAKKQSLVTRAGAGAVIKGLKGINPILRVFNSSSVKAKEMLQRLATHNMLVAKNLDGIASQQSVENSIKQHQAGLGQSILNGRQAFKEFKKRGGTELKNYTEFKTEIAKALRRGDISEIPEVERVAKFYRSKIFDPLKKLAIEEKLLPADVKPETAVSYLTRMYNRKKIIAQEPVLRQRLSDKLSNFILPKIQKGIEANQKLINSKITDIDTEVLRLQEPFQSAKRKILEEARDPNKISDDELFRLLETYTTLEKSAKEVKARSLLQFIREEGGIFDDIGDIRNMINPKKFPFILRKTASVDVQTPQGVRKKSVQSDDVLERAWEGGYFPYNDVKPTMREFLDALDREVRGKKIYSAYDTDDALRKQEAEQFFKDVDAYGIDIELVKKAKKIKELKKPIREKIRTELTKREVQLLEKKKAKLKEQFIEEGQKYDAFLGTPDARQQYVDEIVDSILDKLKGLERYNVTMPYDLRITTRGPLKERTLTFMDDVELEDFLDNDVEKIADYYTRVMGTDVEIKKEFGSLTLDDELDEIMREYKILETKQTTERGRLKLQKEEENVLRDLRALRDIMRGHYGRPNNPDSLIIRGSRISRQLQYLSKLGGVAISSIPDIARTITVHGYGRVFGKGLRGLATNMKGVKLNIKEAKLAGNVLETVLNTRIATMAELTDPYASGSKFERLTTNLSNNFSRINGLTYWNDIMKGFSSVLSQQRIIEESQKLLTGKIKKTDKTYLAFLGIDENMANRITKQIDKFGSQEDNLMVANTEQWTDQVALRTYRNALNLDVDRTIVTKTAGDVPLLMNTELGRTIGQFRSFVFASTQQVLIAGLQQKDMATLQGFTTAVGLGMLVYYLKEKEKGRDPDLSISKLTIEGLDRSGLLGIIMEVNNISEKATRGQVGLNKLVGGEIMSRYASRNLTGSLVGPSSGTIQDTATILGAIATGEITESDIKAFRRMTPYQNLFYIRWLLSSLQE